MYRHCMHLLLKWKKQAAAHILAWRSRLRSRRQTVRTANESARRDASGRAKHARQPSRARELPPAKVQGPVQVLHWALAGGLWGAAGVR